VTFLRPSLFPLAKTRPKKKITWTPWFLPISLCPTVRLWPTVRLTTIILVCDFLCPPPVIESDVWILDFSCFFPFPSAIRSRSPPLVCVVSLFSVPSFVWPPRLHPLLLVLCAFLVLCTHLPHIFCAPSPTSELPPHRSLFRDILCLCWTFVLPPPIFLLTFFSTVVPLFFHLPQNFSLTCASSPKPCAFRFNPHDGLSSFSPVCCCFSSRPVLASENSFLPHSVFSFIV